MCKGCLHEKVCKYKRLYERLVNAIEKHADKFESSPLSCKLCIKTGFNEAQQKKLIEALEEWGKKMCEYDKAECKTCYYYGKCNNQRFVEEFKEKLTSNVIEDVNVYCKAYEAKEYVSGGGENGR